MPPSGLRPKRSPRSSRRRNEREIDIVAVFQIWGRMVCSIRPVVGEAYRLTKKPLTKSSTAHVFCDRQRGHYNQDIHFVQVQAYSSYLQASSSNLIANNTDVANRPGPTTIRLFL